MVRFCWDSAAAIFLAKQFVFFKVWVWSLFKQNLFRLRLSSGFFSERRTITWSSLLDVTRFLALPSYLGSRFGLEDWNRRCGKLDKVAIRNIIYNGHYFLYRSLLMLELFIYSEFQWAHGCKTFIIWEMGQVVLRCWIYLNFVTIFHCSTSFARTSWVYTI